MIVRFVFTGLQVRPRPLYPRPIVQQVPWPTATNSGPLQPLLKSLLGRTIGVMTAERDVDGKLVQQDPVTLVGTDGITTMIPLDRVLSVRF